MNDEPLFPDVRFLAALSLGANCEPAHALRRHGRYGPHGVFDWLVTPLAAVGKIFEDDGARLGQQFIASHLGTSALCNVYGVLYHHEFPRGADNAIVFSPQVIETCRAKMVHKMKSLLDACEDGGPLLFIRMGPESDLAHEEIGPGKRVAGSTDLNRLVAAVERRFPMLDFRLLVVTPTPGFAGDYTDGPLDRRIKVVSATRAVGGDWALDDQTWASLLGRVRFRDPAVNGAAPMKEGLHWFGDAGAIEAAPDDGYRDGLVLLRAGRSHEALQAFRGAFAGGLRDGAFLTDHLGLLAGETSYAEALDVIGRLRAEGVELPRLAVWSGLAKLALAHDKSHELAMAEHRAALPNWLDASGVLTVIGEAISTRRPFSFLRTGDGEARFLIGAGEDPLAPIAPEEADATAEIVWSNWFGEPWSGIGPVQRAELARAFRRAVRSADIVGTTDAERLRADTGHFGYLAWQETWLRQVFTDAPPPYWTSALLPRELDLASPYLSSVLKGLDFLGVISPHPGLADALAARLGITSTASYVIPAEGRLPVAAETRRLGAHYPEVYHKLLTELKIPYPGAVFLVAGGLLGKIYCQRIKKLGGVALDIGALADAWMDFDTRDGQFGSVKSLAAIGPIKSEEVEVDAPNTTPVQAPAAAEAEDAQVALQKLRDRLEAGFAVDFNDYPYKPVYRDGRRTPGLSALEARMKEDEETYRSLMESFLAFNPWFESIPITPANDGPHWENWWLPGLDAVVLYGLVATRRPRLYLEIGSGHSTRFVRKAITDHGLKTKIVSIDPHPTTLIDALCDDVIRTRCEDAPASVFQDLGPEDMLFLDSSHRSFQSSDVTVFFSEILPGLGKGVLYGLHDIFLPYDYPESWTTRYYNEQYLLLAYLLGGGGGDRIFLPTHHVSQDSAFSPQLAKLTAGAKHLDWLASSFWMKRGS